MLTSCVIHFGHQAAWQEKFHCWKIEWMRPVNCTLAWTIPDVEVDYFFCFALLLKTWQLTVCGTTMTHRHYAQLHSLDWEWNLPLGWLCVLEKHVTWLAVHFSSRRIFPSPRMYCHTCGWRAAVPWCFQEHYTKLKLWCTNRWWCVFRSATLLTKQHIIKKDFFLMIKFTK